MGAFLIYDSCLDDSSSSEEMTEVLFVVGVDILIQYFESMLELRFEFFGDKSDKLGLLNVFEFGRVRAEFADEGYFIGVEVGKSSAVDLVLDLQVPDLDRLMSVDENRQSVD